MKDEMFINGITPENLKKAFFYKVNKDLKVDDGSLIGAGTGFIIDSVEKQNINVRFELSESNSYTNEENSYEFSLDKLKDFGEPDIDSIELKNLEGIIDIKFYIEKIINMNVGTLADELTQCLIQDAAMNFYKYEEKMDFINNTYGNMSELAKEYVKSAKEAIELNDSDFVGINEYIECMGEMGNYKNKDVEIKASDRKFSIKDKIESIIEKSKSVSNKNENKKGNAKKLINSQQL